MRSSTLPRLAWHILLDMPVGLAWRDAMVGAAQVPELVLGERGLRYPGPYAGETEQGWLVILRITNTGHVAVRDKDFSAPLTFAFPGRNICTTRIHRESARRAIGRKS
jgi:hypothetical protein